MFRFSTHAQLADTALQSLRTRIEHPAVERYATIALAVIAGLSALVYFVAFVRPYSLLIYYEEPLLHLFDLSKENPEARWSLLWAFLALGALYWLGWRAAKRARGRAAWAIVLGSAVIFSITLLFLYPFGAADIFNYIIYGRIWGMYGYNPFVAVADHFPDDPFHAYVAWKRTPSAYGPGWEMLGAVTARLAGDSIIANVLAFKMVVGAFLAGSIALVALILRRMAPERALAGAVLLAWNPVVLYYTLGNGHNDIAMVFWMLAAVLALVHRRYTLTILALLVGALFKFIPVLLLPAAGLIALRDLPNHRSRLRFLAVTGVAGSALIALAYWPVWYEGDTFGIMRRTRMFTTSLPAVFYAWLQTPLGKQAAGYYISMVAAGLTFLFSIWQGMRAWRDDSWLSFVRASFNILMFYLLVTCLWFQTWYAVWPLGLAALLPPGHAARLAALFGYAILSKPLIFEPMLLWVRPAPPQTVRELWFGPAVLAIPWLYALFAIWHGRRKRET